MHPAQCLSFSISPETVVRHRAREEETLLLFASCLPPNSGLAGQSWRRKAIVMSLDIYPVLELKNWLLTGYQ